LLSDGSEDDELFSKAMVGAVLIAEALYELKNIRRLLTAKE